VPDAMETWLAERERTPEKGLLADGAAVGEWKVLGLVGRGGTAEVYRVENACGVSAALKLMTKGADDTVAHRRFERECQILSAGLGVHFPYWYGRGTVGGHEYLVEELLLPYEALPSRPHSARRYLLAVCEGVAALHAYGFVHRDLKPANVMRRSGADGEDVPVLVDFGLAVPPATAGRSAPDRTMIDGRVVVSGTPGYAAPEMFTGGDVGAAADIHALGVIATKCFCGKVPFLWRALVQRATSSQPTQRPASVASFVKALRRTSAGYVLLSLAVVAAFVYAIDLAFAQIHPPVAAPSVVSGENPRQAEESGGLDRRERDILEENIFERGKRRIGIDDR